LEVGVQVKFTKFHVVYLYNFFRIVGSGLLWDIFLTVYAKSITITYMEFLCHYCR
jgi:hypothetical protein